MSCNSSANQYAGKLVGTVSNQIDRSIGGVLDVVSPNYSPQTGGRRRRTRRNNKRRSLRRRKGGSHKKGSYRSIRRRK